MKRFTVLMTVLGLTAFPVFADDIAAPSTGPAAVFPWYGSLKKAEVNVRSGPGNQYPVLWIYQRAGYPVQVLARYDNYYKLRDVEGEEGWVYVGMVSRRITGLVGGKVPSPLFKHADASSMLVARMAPGVVVEMGACEEGGNGAGLMCKVDVNGTRGWVKKTSLEMVD